MPCNVLLDLCLMTSCYWLDCFAVLILNSGQSIYCLVLLANWFTKWQHVNQLVELLQLTTFWALDFQEIVFCAVVWSAPAECNYILTHLIPSTLIRFCYQPEFHICLVSWTQSGQHHFLYLITLSSWHQMDQKPTNTTAASI